jgi:ubiquinone/menaquinone biosynthesis C-methylase UbiE
LIEIERFLEEKMNPIFRAYYAVWVHWWPVWRNITGKVILRKWQEFDLVREGQTILDYGCGTGYFTVPAAQMVKESGKVYALDYFERQLSIVQKRISENGLTNVETIRTDSEIALPDESVDVVWMCDVLHEIREKRTVMAELHRVLKREGALAIYDGMGHKTLEYTSDLFSLARNDSKFFRFTKINR